MNASTIRANLQCASPNCMCHKSHNVHCPAHDDSMPSLTVNEDAAGLVLINCKKGCSQKAVIAALKERGLWGEEENHNGNGSIPHPDIAPVALYEYRNESGDLVAEKGRFEYSGGRKSFKWRLPGADDWSGLKGKPMSEIPLWGTDLIRLSPQTEPIYFVEGEKACLSCREQGLLAVTHGGGASTTDFGESLQILKGRTVVLWPDNDEPGRRYMTRINAALRPITKAIHSVNPPLPEKGDAFDFFQSGGSLSQLLENMPPAEPTVDYLSHDALRIRMACPSGVLSFTFTNMEKTSRDLNTELEVMVGDTGEPYSQRINILSGSAVTELRRNLDQIYSKDFGWTQLLNTAIAKARRSFLEQDRAIRLADIPDMGPPAFLIPEFLPLGVPTVWFGTGSSCKTYLALRAGVSVATGIPFMGLRATKQGAVMLVDYEDTSSSFRFRSMRILAGLGIGDEENPALLHWPARGIPLVDQIEAIRAKVERDGVTLIIIDSAAAACGGKPEDAETALRYFMALQKLGDGVTTLTIAHVPKGSDEMRPFGSIFWENQARRSINFARTDDEDTDDMDVGVFFRKVNQGKKPKAMAFHVHFDNDIGPVTMTKTDINTIPSLNGKLQMKDQAWNALTEAGMTAKEIAEVIDNGNSEDRTFMKSLRSTLGKFPKLFYRVEVGKGRGSETKWARVSNIEENGHSASLF